MTNPEPSIAWNVVLTIGVLVAIGANIIVLLRGNRAQKREVSFEFTPASKAEHDQHVADTANNFAAVREELKEDRRRNEVHASERSKTIFKELKDNRERLEDQISAVDKKVAGLEASSEIQTQQLARLDTKLDRIIENKLT